MEHGEITVKCCKCHRVRENGSWTDERDKEAARRRYSHSYCPACLNQMHADIEVSDFARAEC